MSHHSKLRSDAWPPRFAARCLCRAITHSASPPASLATVRLPPRSRVPLHLSPWPSAALFRLPALPEHQQSRAGECSAVSEGRAAQAAVQCRPQYQAGECSAGQGRAGQGAAMQGDAMQAAVPGRAHMSTDGAPRAGRVRSQSEVRQTHLSPTHAHPGDLSLSPTWCCFWGSWNSCASRACIHPGATGQVSQGE